MWLRFAERIQENGAQVTFTLAGAAYAAPPRVTATLVNNADGTFTRVWPAKAGTLACGATGTIAVNPDTAFQG